MADRSAEHRPAHQGRRSLRTDHAGPRASRFSSDFCSPLERNIFGTRASIRECRMGSACKGTSRRAAPGERRGAVERLGAAGEREELLPDRRRRERRRLLARAEERELVLVRPPRRSRRRLVRTVRPLHLPHGSPPPSAKRPRGQPVRPSGNGGDPGERPERSSRAGGSFSVSARNQGGTRGVGRPTTRARTPSGGSGRTPAARPPPPRGPRPPSPPPPRRWPRRCRSG
jgi:hypothetical protein